MIKALFILLLTAIFSFAGVSGTESGTGGGGLSSIPSGFTNNVIQTGTFTATNGATVQGSLTVTNALITGNVVFGPNNINAGGGSITNLADAVNAKDAVTFSQLQGATNGITGGGSDAQALYTNGTRRMAASLNMGGNTITNAAAATVLTGIPIMSQMNASNALYVTVSGLNSTNSAMNLPRVANTPHRSTYMSNTNGPPGWVPWNLLKDAPNWEANVDNMWETQTVASLVPVISTNYLAPGASTIPSAKTYYATNNIALPWYVMWGNIPTNYSAGSPFVKGVFPINPSGGGNFMIRTRTAEITNEFQFFGHTAGQSVVAFYVNGHPLGSSNWQMRIPQSTNCNVKLVFNSYRSREITIACSGYGGATMAFGYGFVNPGGTFFQPQFRDDGCHYVTGDSGIMGYGNGGEDGVTNSAGGFLGGLMLMTGQEWIYDGTGGSAYMTPDNNGNFLSRMTNSVPLLMARGKRVMTIWAMGGGSDNTSNAASIFAAVTNYYIKASNSFPTIERYCAVPWDASVGGSYVNAATNIQRACNAIGVPCINFNNNIDSTMLASPQYVWTSGPFVGHPTSNGHKLLEDQFLRYFMTQTNGFRSGR